MSIAKQRRDPRGRGRTLNVAALVALAALALPHPAAAQDTLPAVGKAAAQKLRFEPLVFRPPEPELHTLSDGVRVLYLEDRSLPLVNVFAHFRGGFSNFPRAYYAAATALPMLVRNGGTKAVAPDSLDALFEEYAIDTSVGGGGESSFATLNTLTRNLDVALDLFGAMLRTPRFDPKLVEVWRGQELDNVRRQADNPGQLAYAEFNRLVFGDHPIGWRMDASDLEPDDLSQDKLAWVHDRVFCPQNLILGVAGDVSWADLAPRLERLVKGWPACAEPLPRIPAPKMRSEPGVYVIARPLEQSTVVMAEPDELRLADTPEYYASRIGTEILGSGGLSSRLMARVRTEKGYAYGASALWNVPRSYDGLIGAVTQTKPESTVAAIRLILSTMGEMTREPPTADEVGRTVDEIANGFVFNFESPAQIVARRMTYLADRLPDDWLERYLAGIQKVTPESIRDVFARYLHPERMIILVLGDPKKLDEPLEKLGPVTSLPVPDAQGRIPPGG